MRSTRTGRLTFGTLLILFIAAVTSHAAPDRPIPRVPVDLPDVVVAVPPGMGGDSIRALSPRIPSHARPRGAPPGGGCDKDVDLSSTIKSVVNVAALDTGICSNADIDTYKRGSNTYVVMAGQEEAAWTHTDVTDPTNPVVLAQYVWIRGAKGTNSPDVKSFQQGATDYIVLATELGGGAGTKGTCGAYIFDVTNPLDAIMVSRVIESGVWCSVHNVFVEDDGSGDGEFLYITANASADLRVFDISNPANPVKLGTYQRISRGFGGSGFYDDVYVHDVTVGGGMVYAAYWAAGLDFFAASLVKTAGGVINETHPDVENIDPPDFLSSGNPFLVHHAFPSGDGSLVGIEDEIEIDPGAEVVQLWGTSFLDYVDGLAQGVDVPILPAHNLEIRDDLFPDRLFVGWYQAGMQAWDFGGGFLRNANPEPRTAELYHQVQTDPGENPYSGAWGVRLESITVGSATNTYIFTSDRNFGLIVDCVGCTQAAGAITGTVTDSATSDPIQSASVSTDTGQSTTTGTGGAYTLTDVPTGTRTVTASATGYVTQQKQTTVTEGGTSVVDFALEPEPTAATGSVKGRVRDAGTGKNLGGVLVEIVETGQSDTTNKGGRYAIDAVPEGVVTVRASKSGYVTQEVTATVQAGQTTTVDFAL